jgi:hypothetical protein
VRQRYVEQKVASRIEMWTFAHQPPTIRNGRVLRLITSAWASVRWSVDGWQAIQDQETVQSGLGCWFADLATSELAQGTNVFFTFRWQEKWEGRDYSVEVM